MATPIFTGSALATYDTWTATFGGTWETSDVITFTIGDKTYSTTAQSTTITTIISTMVSEWNALDATRYPEFAEYTAAVGSSTTMTLTADKAGVPGTIAVATTETGGGAADAQTLSISNTTVATGPNFWSNAENWSTGAVPVNSDSVYFENSNIDVLYGLDQSAVTVTLLQIAKSYTGRIGLPRTNANGYIEYRNTYLAIGATTCTIGQGDGSGSRRIKINFGTVQTAASVFGSASSEENGVPAINLKGTNASNTITVTEGSFGSCVFATETATWATVRIGHEQNQQTDVSAYFGSGNTLSGTFKQTGGVVVSDATVTTLNRYGGEMTLRSAAAATTVNNYGGVLWHESTGTITTLNNYATFRKDRFIGANTITTTNLYKGSQTLDPGGTITWTNAPNGNGIDIGDKNDCTFLIGKNRKITIADI